MLLRSETSPCILQLPMRCAWTGSPAKQRAEPEEVLFLGLILRPRGVQM
jgi:hypothetical protein